MSTAQKVNRNVREIKPTVTKARDFCKCSLLKYALWVYSIILAESPGEAIGWETGMINGHPTGTLRRRESSIDKK